MYVILCVDVYVTVYTSHGTVYTVYVILLCSYVCHCLCHNVCICHHICHTVHRCVCISLEAADDTDVVLALSYVVSNASWSPQYDLRVFSNNKTMKVSLFNA